MKRARVVLGFVVAGCCPSPAKPTLPTPPPVAAEPPAPPPVAVNPLVAAQKPVTNTYHGVAVGDPYQWLEADDADVHAWSAAQNVHAREVLDHLPNLAALHTELHDILAAPVTKFNGLEVANGKLFANRKQPDHEQPEIVVMDDPAKPGAAKLIFDPAAVGGAQQAVDWWRPSPDGTKIAMSISVGGSEAGSLHVLGLDGKELEPVIPNVQRGTGGGDLAWTADSKGFYYTRYPSPGERPANELDGWLTVWSHTLGTPIAQDKFELGKDLPKIAEIQLASDKSGRVIATVQNGDGEAFRHYVHDATGWRQLDDWNDHIVAVEFGPKDDFWVVSRDKAPRGKLLRLGAHAKSGAAATVVVPEGKDALVVEFDEHHNLVTFGDRVFAIYQLGGPSELRAFTFDGKPAAVPPQPPIGTVGTPVVWKNAVLYPASSYVTQWAYHLFDPVRHTVSELPDLLPKIAVDLSAFDVSREMATSKDGTQVPLNIVWPKGAPKDGSTPCLVTGYGGYGVNITPRFLGAFSPLLKRGVCFVEINLRGGGEFGDAWHQALTHKQNVFDDLTAALEYMVAHKYSSSDKLAIFGGSNGGLLMGAMITQHPELVHAVVSEVGIYDMLRVELSPNGAYNVTEFGSVADEDQFKALYAYSPYHHVVPRAYPAILMTTGANDPRVSPWQSRKMIAALQAAQTGPAPILLRTSDAAGHGMGSSTTESVDLMTHVEGFLLWQLKP
jgi:prolyl oligopeptidase